MNLVRYAAGLGVPMYRLFCEDDEAPPRPNLTPREDLEELANDAGGKTQRRSFS